MKDPIKVLGASPRNLIALKNALSISGSPTHGGKAKAELGRLKFDKKNKDKNFPFKLSLVPPAVKGDPPTLNVQEGRVQIEDITQSRAYVAFEGGNSISLDSVWNAGNYFVVLLISFIPGSQEGDNTDFIPTVYFLEDDGSSTADVPNTRGLFSTIIGYLQITSTDSGDLICAINQKIIGDININMISIRHPFSITAYNSGISDGDLRTTYSEGDIGARIAEGGLYLGNVLQQIPEQDLSVKETNYIYLQVNIKTAVATILESDTQIEPKPPAEGEDITEIPFLLGIIQFYPNGAGIVIQQFSHSFIGDPFSEVNPLGLQGSMDTYFEVVPNPEPTDEQANPYVLRWKNEFKNQTQTAAAGSGGGETKDKSYSFLMENKSSQLELKSFTPKKASQSLLIWDKYSKGPIINEPDGGGESGSDVNICIGDNSKISWKKAKELFEGSSSIKVDAKKEKIQFSVVNDYFKSLNGSIKIVGSESNLDFSINYDAFSASPSILPIQTMSDQGISELKFEIIPAFFTSKDNSVLYNSETKGGFVQYLDLSATKVAASYGDETPGYLTDKLGETNSIAPYFTLDQIYFNIVPSFFTSKDGSVEYSPEILHDVAQSLDLSAKKVAASYADENPGYLTDKLGETNSIAPYFTTDEIYFNIVPSFFTSSDGSIFIDGITDAASKVTNLDFKGSGKIRLFPEDSSDYLPAKIDSSDGSILFGSTKEGKQDFRFNFDSITAKPPLKIEKKNNGIEISLDIPKGPGILFVDSEGKLSVIPIGEGVAVGNGSSISWVKPEPCEK